MKFKVSDHVLIDSPRLPTGSTGVVRFCVEHTSAQVCVDGTTIVHVIPSMYLILTEKNNNKQNRWALKAHR